MTSRSVIVSHSLTVVAVAWLLITVLSPIFVWPLDGDFVVYALPAANWLERGVLALPQLGSQYDFDKYWRFHAPLMGAGALPCFQLFGISHGSYLVGLTVLAVATACGLALLFRKAIGGPAWCWIGATVAVISVRGFLIVELTNQRYSVVCPLFLAILYFPRAGPAGITKWAIAGILPLLHPALLPASVVWVCAELWRVYRDRTVSKTGLAVFALGVGLCAAWYLDRTPFRVQFLPHLQSRGFVPFSGWKIEIGWRNALPSQAIMASVFATALFALRGTLPQGGRRVVILTAVILLMDVAGRMVYLPYFAVGLAPALFCLVRPRPWFVWCMRWLVLLGLANTFVFMRTSLVWPVPPTDQQAAEQFVLEHTQPGERICLGPPFTLVAAKRELPGGRVVPRVVPTALYLANLDEDAFLTDIRDHCTVYIGFPEEFTGVQREYRLTSPPIFVEAEVATLYFQGRPVIVARPRR